MQVPWTDWIEMTEPNIKLTLTVHDQDAGGGFGSNYSHLFTRDVYWPFLPGVDEYSHMVQVCKNGDGEWYGYTQVKMVWFEPDSEVVHVELVDYQLTPNQFPELLKQGYRHGWNVDIDGDLKEQLLASGWRRYGDAA